MRELRPRGEPQKKAVVPVLAKAPKRVVQKNIPLGRSQKKTFYLTYRRSPVRFKGKGRPLRKEGEPRRREDGEVGVGGSSGGVGGRKRESATSAFNDGRRASAKRSWLSFGLGHLKRVQK